MKTDAPPPPIPTNPGQMEKTEKTMAELQVRGGGEGGRREAAAPQTRRTTAPGAGASLLNAPSPQSLRPPTKVDLNMRFEFDAITEAGAHLVPLSGPGHVGLVNLGNSCYMNSCLQVGGNGPRWLAPCVLACLLVWF